MAINISFYIFWQKKRSAKWTRPHSQPHLHPYRNVHVPRSLVLLQLATSSSQRQRQLQRAEVQEEEEKEAPTRSAARSSDEDDDDDDQTVPDQRQPQAASATDSPTSSRTSVTPCLSSPLLLPRLCLCHFCIMNRRSMDGTAAETELTDWDMEMEGWDWD